MSHAVSEINGGWPLGELYIIQVTKLMWILTSDRKRRVICDVPLGSHLPVPSVDSDIVLTAHIADNGTDTASNSTELHRS